MSIFATLLFFGQILAVGSHTGSVSASRPASNGPTASISTSRPTSNSTAALVSVAGRVITGNAGEPLPGVVVVVQGTSQATSTNASGEFLLSIPTTKSVLLFKCQGYRDCSVEMNGPDALSVKMYPTSLSATAESSNVDAAGTTPVLTYSEEPPTFPGGDAAYRSYMRQNARYPEQAAAKNISGTVYVSFVVDEQGRISDAAITKGLGAGLDEEALRLIRLMPWWNPGRVGGKPVRVSRILPIPFVLRDRP